MLTPVNIFFLSFTHTRAFVKNFGPQANCQPSHDFELPSSQPTPKNPIQNHTALDCFVRITFLAMTEKSMTDTINSCVTPQNLASTKSPPYSPHSPPVPPPAIPRFSCEYPPQERVERRRRRGQERGPRSVPSRARRQGEN